MVQKPQDPSSAPWPEPGRAGSSRPGGRLTLTERERTLLQRRSIARHRSNMKGNPGIKGLALLLGLALVVALVVDLTRQFRRLRERPVFPSAEDPAALALGVRDRVYRDPAGRFQVTVPEAWAVLTGEDIAPFDVQFGGPNDLTLAVQASPAASDRFDLLLKRIRKIEDNYGVNMNIRTNAFKGSPAVERTTRMVSKTVRAVDFIAQGQEHHLQAAAQRDSFEASEAFLLQLLQTYVPGPIPAGEGNLPVPAQPGRVESD